MVGSACRETNWQQFVTKRSRLKQTVIVPAPVLKTFFIRQETRLYSSKDTVLFFLWREEAILLTSFCKQSCSVKITHAEKNQDRDLKNLSPAKTWLFLSQDLCSNSFRYALSHNGEVLSWGLCNQGKSYHSAQSLQTKTRNEPIRIRSENVQVNGTEQAKIKTRRSKSRLVLVLLLIGRESGVSFLPVTECRKQEIQFLSPLGWKLPLHLFEILKEI